MVINTFYGIIKDDIVENTCITFLGNRMDDTFSSVAVNYKIVDHSDSVRILLEDVMIIDRIHLSDGFHKCFHSRCQLMPCLVSIPHHLQGLGGSWWWCYCSCWSGGFATYITVCVQSCDQMA